MATGFAYMNIERLAVLIIDMQYVFVDTQEKRDLIPNHIAVVKFCADKNIPVVMIELVGCGSTVRELKEEVNKLPKKNVFKLKKAYNSAFNATYLHEELQVKKIRTLVLMGVNAGYCIHATGISAINLGYEIITSSDLIAGYNGSSADPQWYMRNGVYVDKYTDLINK
jgi:nicotinamidase-related amidase